MAEERKLRGRAKRASYFSATATGEYVYTGPLYRPGAGQGPDWKRAMRRRLVLSAACAVLSAVCGCVSVPGMGRTFYVLIPYSCGLIACCSVLWAVVQMAGGERGLREYVYRATVEKLPLRTAVAALCAGLTLCGEAVYLLRQGAELAQLPVLAAFFLFEGAVLVMSLALHRTEGQIRWEIDRDSGNHCKSADGS